MLLLSKKHTLKLTLIEVERSYNRMNTKSGDLKNYSNIYYEARYNKIQQELSLYTNEHLKWKRDPSVSLLLTKMNELLIAPYILF